MARIHSKAADSIVAYLIGIIPFIDIFAEERARVVELLLVNVGVAVARRGHLRG